jgi:HAD superfamily hydrolase (TIGR01490 family)
MTVATGVPYLVFCDVDETLIRPKSMFDFLEFHTEPAEHRRVVAELRDLAARGVPRTEVNRAYYRAWRGRAAAGVRAAGRDWFADRAARPGFWVEETRDALARHRAAGAHLVLVSGSFDAPLRPVADAVGAHHLLCTRPVTDGGRYTGAIEEPMIGDHKRAAVARLLAAHPQVDPARCWAYGDHPSDLPMLDLVGNPVAVGDDPAVAAHLAARAALPGTRGATA